MTSVQASGDVILETVELGPQWPTLDPFLFCAHHDDDYPAGDGSMAPAASLAGRAIGSDFSGTDGWSLYHGSTVPGFPRHPHRGFETITYCRHGYIDHSDSLGATARFGRGDVQWMTAGKGIEHSEMFPLVNSDSGNLTELFQVWLNLPANNKLVEPYFTMLWNDDIPKLDIEGGGQITVIVGRLGDAEPGTPPPDSWAANEDARVGMWHIVLPAGGSWTIPATVAGSNRMLYLFEGDGLVIGDRAFEQDTGIRLRADVDIEIQSGDVPTECLLLQGVPIGEPVAQYGPFVMNSAAQIQQAFDDYRRGVFGHWPWSSDDPVHPLGTERFAKRPDEEVDEEPDTDPAVGGPGD